MKRNHGRQEGSVFVVALMALAVLMIIGLGLALVTETEMLIGGNEQVINETFYAAETGAAVAVAQLMVANNTDGRCLGLQAKEEDGSDRMVGVRKLGYSVDTTSVYPVSFDVMPYTKANENREDKLYAGFFRGESRALRGSWPAGDAVPREAEEKLEDIDFVPQAEKTITLAFYSAPLQPLEAGTLIGAFDHPEVLGCEPHPAHDEVVAVP